MKELVFLPDRTGRDELTDAQGFVRCGAGKDALKQLADRLVVPRRRSAQSLRDTWRAVMAMALLADVWPGEAASTRVITIGADASPFASWVMASRPAEKRQEAVRLLVLEMKGERRLMGVVDEECGLTLPATPTLWQGIIPERVRWYDAETDELLDPVPFLTETEKRILAARMQLMGLCGEDADSLMEDLRLSQESAREGVRLGDEDALRELALRVQAVCGLKDMTPFSTLESECAVVAQSPLMACFTGEDVDSALGGRDVTYLWNSVPFAVSDSLCGLLPAGAEGESEALSELGGEMALLTEHSTRWNRETAEQVLLFLEGWHDREPMLETAYEAIAAMRRGLKERARQEQGEVALRWPWNAESCAVQYLVQESLGSGWQSAAAQPFADRLAILAGCTLGDTALASVCAWEGGVIVPPLSREAAACMLRSNEGEGLQTSSMSFTALEEGGVEASFLIKGAGSMRVTRVYAPEEILTVDREMAPAAAVWPCLPMKQWTAYHVLCRGSFITVQAMGGGEWLQAPAQAAWSCIKTDQYPACLYLSREEWGLGVVPNVLPGGVFAMKKEAVAALSLGSMTTATALLLDGQPAPTEEGTLLRMVLRPEGMQTDALLAGLEPFSVTPTAVMLTGPGDALFTDGYLYRAPDMAHVAEADAEGLRTSLKWRADADSVRARRLLMHQMMLKTALTATLSGAGSISWRVTVADEMVEEGRQALTDLVDEMAQQVALESGLPLTLGKETALWAEETPALHAYLKGDGGLRGSFLALDLGGGSTRMHLWMQGQLTPAAGAVVLRGVTQMACHALTQCPDVLDSDFADCADEALRGDAALLKAQLEKAGSDHREAARTILMFTLLTDTHRAALTAHLSARAAAQRPTYLQAILLEALGAAAFATGLMLAQVGDDNMINHRLPDDITLCLSGRGAWLMDTLTPPMRNGLQHMARSMVRLDHPVRFVTLKKSPEELRGAALGVAILKESGRTADCPFVHCRTSFSEMMCSMMRQMNAAFPLHQWLLHGGMADDLGGLTMEGEEAIRRAAAQAYGDGEDIPASIMDFVGRMAAAPILQEYTPMPQS